MLQNILTKTGTETSVFQVNLPIQNGHHGYRIPEAPDHRVPACIRSFPFYLFIHILNSTGMNSAVGNEFFHNDTGNFTPHRIKSTEND